jgi:hypothetical protein
MKNRASSYYEIESPFPTTRKLGLYLSARDTPGRGHNHLPAARRDAPPGPGPRLPPRLFASLDVNIAEESERITLAF